MTDFKYQLSTTSKKDLCPSCGKKSFTPYVYSASKEPVDINLYGICDRSNNCSFHHHPNEDKDFQPDQNEISKPVIKEFIEQIFPSQKQINAITQRTKTAVSPLHTYCKRLTIPVDHLLKWGVYSDEEKTLFLYINTDNQVCNIKTFKYLDNGHRDKSKDAYSLKNPPPSHTPKKSNSAGGDVKIINKYLLCGFGEHLLDPEKERTVCIVESEKSAVMASFFYPQFDWIACGSANGLGVANGVRGDFKIKSLYGRKIYWLADADAAGRENSSLRLLRKYNQNVVVIDLWPERNDGYDIGDAIDEGLRPEIAEPQETYEDKLDQKISESTLKLFDLPDGVELADVQDDLINYSHFMHENRVHISRKYKGADDYEYHTQTITNFSIQPLGLIESRDFPRRLISVTNIFNHTKVLQIPTKAFASNTEFTVFIESEGNFQYDGANSDLKKIRSRLYDNMPSFEEVDTLGWHQSGVFIWANGIFDKEFHPVDKHGFVVHKKRNFFIEFNSCINDNNSEDFEDEKKFNYVTDSNITLRDWAAQYMTVHKENGMISMAWFFASLFRDFIYRQFKFFPHLFLFGPPGTGKSQIGWSMRSLGFDGIKKPFNLSGGTKVSFHREFSHFVNFPCWFDEFDNNIDYDRVQSLKAAYDGAGHKKSVKDSDKRTKTVPVNSAALISGQQLPVADNALFKRVVLLQFHQTEYSDEEKDLFRDLQNIEENGLSHITMQIIGLRKVIEEKFMDTFDEVLKDLTIETLKIRKDMEDRMVRNMSIACAVYKIAREALGTDLPFTYEHLKALAITNLTEQMALIAGANETNSFWDMVEFLIDQQLIEEKVDYKFETQRMLKIYHDGQVIDKDLGEPKQILMIRMTRVIPLYKENFKRQSNGTQAPMDRGSLTHYLKHQKYFIGTAKSVRFDTPTKDYEGGKKKTMNSSCMLFDYDLMEQMQIELKRGGSDDNMSTEPDSDGPVFPLDR